MLTDFFDPQYWAKNIYGTQDFLQPIDTTDGLVIGQPIHSSLVTTFSTASAYFNGTINNDNQGLNYFINGGYGNSFTAFGGAFVGIRARGTAVTPSQTLAGDYLTVHSSAGYSGTGWSTSGATHILSGMYIQAAADVTSTIETDVFLGGALTKMIGFETDTNAIKFNESQLDSDMSFYYGAGIAMFLQGSNGYIGMGSITPETKLVVAANTAHPAPTLGTASGSFSVLGGSATYGLFVGIANTGTSWIQSMRKDASATAYGISLNPSGGNVGVGIMSPTAFMHLAAGTTAASGAPLKFNTGTNMTNAEVGAMEFTTGRLYFTPVLTRNIITSTVDTDTTAVGNVTTGEDDLITYSIPANTMGTNGDYISFRASGTIANSINAKRLRVKYGGTTVMDTGAAGIPISAAIQWVVEGEIIRTGATTQKCNASLTTNNATLATYSGYSTAAETLSGAVTLKLTGEAVATDDIIQETFTARSN